MRENSEVVIVYPDKMILKHEAKRSEKNVFWLDGELAVDSAIFIQPIKLEVSTRFVNGKVDIG